MADPKQPALSRSDNIRAMLADIERKRAAMPPDERAKLEREEYQAQRESWVRGMSTPCEHGMLDFEQCGDCAVSARNAMLARKDRRDDR